MGSCYVAQDGLKLVRSSEPPTSASEIAGVTYVFSYLAKCVTLNNENDAATCEGL